MRLNVQVFTTNSDYAGTRSSHHSHLRSSHFTTAIPNARFAECELFAQNGVAVRRGKVARLLPATLARAMPP